MPRPLLHQSCEWMNEMFYLTTHSTHFIYGYMASDIWLRTILIVRKETRCRHIGYSYRLTARVILYAPSHRQDNIYHGLCHTSRGVLAGTRNNPACNTHWAFGVTKAVVCAILSAWWCIYIHFNVLLVGKCSGGSVGLFPLSLAEWSFIISLTPYNRK